MPIKSKAQRRKFAELLIKGEISPETFEEWNRAAGNAELPERLHPKAKAKRKRKKAKVKRKRNKARVKRKRKVKSKRASKSKTTRVKKRSRPARKRR
jgi:hypothetical protein